MGVFKTTCPKIGPLKFYGTCLNAGFDFLLKSNAKTKNIDELIFLDSRGVGRDFNESLAEKIITKIKYKKVYMIVCRPIELTTWATLVNFLALNSIKTKRIITNMGFVDFTPKKAALLNNAVKQVDFIIGKGVAKPIFAENYVSSEGRNIKLYCTKYSKKYKQKIEKIAKNTETLIINTPKISKKINLLRKRPNAFFTSLTKTLLFNQSIEGAKIVNLPNFDETLTYDGVHYTNLGNKIIFNKIQEYL